MPPPPGPPAITERGQDRSITGGNLRIDAGEVVHDVTVMAQPRRLRHRHRRHLGDGATCTSTGAGT